MMTRNARQDVRQAATLAVRYWPNSHLGDYSPREDLRSAFRMMRSHLRAGESIQAAAGAVEMDAYRHANM